MVERVRHQLFLPKPVSDRLEALAATPGASKSAILADAVTARFPQLSILVNNSGANWAAPFDECAQLAR